MYQNRRRQPGMGLMLLFYQLFGVIGIENIPPVTLGCIGLQVAIFLRLFQLPWRDASQVCISVHNVWKKKEFMRLLYGALEHGDDWHLYYNMFSFALKGQSLERRYGRAKFLYILSSFTILTSVVLVALNILANKHLGFDKHACSIGFSGVIFALKVLTTYHNDNYTHQIMGIPVLLPARYAVWVELVLIQIMVPNVSFFGHLAGILVGMAYVKGPLKCIMDLVYSVITGKFGFPSQPRFTPRTERSGYANERSGYANERSGYANERSGYASESFSQYVPPGMSEEEQLRRAMQESMQESSRRQSSNSHPPYPDGFGSGSSPPPPGFVFRDTNFGQPSPPPGFVFRDDNSGQPPAPGVAPDIDELRNRRSARFSSNNY